MTRQLTVEREQYGGKNCKQYWAYLVCGKVRGRDVKVNSKPKDAGGYEPLDMVFDIAPTATLIMSDEVTTDKNSDKMQYTAYRVQNADEDGIIYECGVKPCQDSVLTMLLNTLNATAEKAVKK